MADPTLATKFFEQLLEPSRPATALEPYYHPLANKLSVEAAYFFRLPVVQLQPFYLSIFSCQITNRLLASMKVDPDIYFHRRLLLLTQIVSTVSLTTYGWRRLLHTIRPDPDFYVVTAANPCLLRVARSESTRPAARNADRER